MISSYLQLDKAKHGQRIRELAASYYELTDTIYKLEMELVTLKTCIDKQYLKDPDNLHFLDVDSAVYYFEELTDNFMSDFNSVGMVDKCLCDCYVNGVRYTPRFDGEAWAIGGEPFIKMFKLTKTGENDE